MEEKSAKSFRVCGLLIGCVRDCNSDLRENETEWEGNRASSWVSN